MKIEAKITSEWRKRMTLIIVFILGASGWFFYDGLIGYPKKQERYTGYKAFLQQKIDEGSVTSESDTEFRNAWNQEAVARGWRREIPKEVTDGDILEQKRIGGAAAVIGFAFMVWLFISSRRVLKADDDTIYSTNGAEVRYEWIDAIDDKKWRSKGIVYAYYNEDGTSNGKRKKLTLDDYKYGGAIEIIKRVASQLDHKLAS